MTKFQKAFEIFCPNCNERVVLENLDGRLSKSIAERIEEHSSKVDIFERIE